MSASNSYERLVLKYLLRGEAIPAITAPYMGLSIVDPGEDGAGVSEPPGANGYARVNLLDSNGLGFPAWLAATIDGANGDNVFNDNDIIFPAASDDWGIVDFWFIADHATNQGDAILSSGQLATSRNVKAGERLRFNAGTFSITAE